MAFCRALILCVLILAACGCDYHQGDKTPAIGENQRVFRATGDVTADQLFPLAPRSAAFHYAVGGPSDKSMTYTLRNDGSPIWYSTLEGLRTDRHQRGDDGALLLMGYTDFEDGAYVDYNPPIMLLPPSMGHNTLIVRQTEVFVRDQAGGDVKRQGKCQYKVQLLGRQRIPTGVGEVDGYVVLLERTHDLGMTQVTLSTWSGYDLGRGLVAQRLWQKTTTMRVLDREKNWSLVLNAGQ